VDATLLEPHVEVDLGIPLVRPGLASCQRLGDRHPLPLSFFGLGPISHESISLVNQSQGCLVEDRDLPIVT
jgi:hypothetical protein